MGISLEELRALKPGRFISVCFGLEGRQLALVVAPPHNIDGFWGGTPTVDVIKFRANSRRWTKRHSAVNCAEICDLFPHVGDAALRELSSEYCALVAPCSASPPSDSPPTILPAPFPSAEFEAAIDQFGLAEVCDKLATICGLKADHIEANWQDRGLARTGSRASKRLRAVADNEDTPRR